MNRLILVLITMLSTVTIANENDTFIASWEQTQSNSKYIENFEKVENDLYKVKFSKMPYEGVLRLISYDIEDISYGDGPITSSGIAIVELESLPTDFIEKYSRIYYSWNETNELFYNSKDEKWITAKEYRTEMKEIAQSSDSTNIFTLLLQNWDYIFIAIILYFVISSISNSRKVNLSVKLQQEAIKNANELQEQSLKIQNEAINTSKAMHEITNNTLKEILEHIRK